MSDQQLNPNLLQNEGDNSKDQVPSLSNQNHEKPEDQNSEIKSNDSKQTPEESASNENNKLSAFPPLSPLKLPTPPTNKCPRLPLPIPPTNKCPLLPLSMLKSNPVIQDNSPSSARAYKKPLMDFPQKPIKTLNTDIIPEEQVNPNDIPNFEGFSDNEEKEDDFFDDFAFDLPVEQSFSRMILDGKKKCEISFLLQKLRTSQ